MFKEHIQINKKNSRAENGQWIGTEEKSQMANKHTKRLSA